MGFRLVLLVSVQLTAVVRSGRRASQHQTACSSLVQLSSVMNRRLRQRENASSHVEENSLVGRVAAPMERPLFVGGDDGHHSYRIPSIVWVGGSRLLAFAEGRVLCNGDSGDIDLVYKVSDDNGNSWSSLQVLAGDGGSIDTWGNPTAVYERPWTEGPEHGRVHVFFNWNRNGFRQFPLPIKDGHDDHGCPASDEVWEKPKPYDRRTYYTYSDDAGQTWSERQDLTDDVGGNKQDFDLVGPGVGIQKQFAPMRGLLVVPASRRNFISDDHGTTWKAVYATSDLSGRPKFKTSETTIAECEDGRLYRNDRAVGGAWETSKRRWTLHIDDPEKPANQAFSPDESLLDPRSEGSILAYTPDKLILLNSASTGTRRKMRVRLSSDCGQTWKLSKWLYEDQPDPISWWSSWTKGGYSSMTKTSDFSTAVLQESASELDKATKMNIEFLKFDLRWLCGDRSYCNGVACRVEDQRAHNGKPAGAYFHAHLSCVEQGMQATLSGAGGVARVQHRSSGGELIRTVNVKVWPRDVNGGRPGDCHGRVEPRDDESTWNTGDVLLFPADP